LFILYCDFSISTNPDPQPQLILTPNPVGAHVALDSGKDRAARENNNAMTSVTPTTTNDNDNKSGAGAGAKYEFYPTYCNAVSPTLRTWCPLTAHDIFGLQWKVTVENQKYMFFHLNHPISWVRIVGVVVAIDSFYSRRIYTIDDSSGACIEQRCRGSRTMMIPPTTPAAAAADPYPNIETGLVVDIKGVLTVFRNEPQIGVVKMAHVRSTNAEVAFWAKIRAFRAETLARPWVVDAAMVRRLKRHNEKEAADSKTRNKRDGSSSSTSRSRSSRSRGEAFDDDGGSSSKRSSRSSRTDEERVAREHTTSRESSRRHRREDEGGHRSSRRKADGGDDAEQQEEVTADQQTEQQRSKRRREDTGKKQWEGNPSLRHKPHRPSKLSEVATYTEGQYDALGL
ncbi:hypothetical protein PG987_001352, partial [Apiospora arundinis]